ncbi:coiled-coil domain-containing protein 80-like isoform X3 [Dermacentor silvarum]|uniref:coiled-coil domain-containing protein 80-like isoform X3 n=1 Tax=Dermacentor silvarum TaxID=543639 RepID=UPI001898974D|nr:coiled-coil domain-containing protein 80-like isoform X3 [Dermacentor silvarum]
MNALRRSALLLLLVCAVWMDHSGIVLAQGEELVTPVAAAAPSTADAHDAGVTGLTSTGETHPAATEPTANAATEVTTTTSTEAPTTMAPTTTTTTTTTAAPAPTAELDCLAFDPFHNGSYHRKDTRARGPQPGGREHHDRRADYHHGQAKRCQHGCGFVRGNAGVRALPGSSVVRRTEEALARCCWRRYAS